MNSSLQNSTHNFSRTISNALANIFLKSLVFFAFLYALDAFFRAVFIIKLGIFEKHLGEVESWQILQTFINGSRYFGQIIGVVSLIVFVLLLCLQCKKIRVIFQKILYIFIALIICLICFVNIANMGFYEIYGDTFNANLLGLIFDDRVAIFDTAMGGDYHLSVKILAFIVCSVIFVALIRFIFRQIDKIKWEGAVYAILLFLIFSFAVLFAINGHFGLRGISLGQHIKPVTNTFLRQISTGAFRDLYIVSISYKKIKNSQFSDYIDENPRKIVENFSGKMIESEINLLDILKKQVENPLVESSVNKGDSSISHIFYIIAESMSEWHFDSIFDEIDLSTQLKKLINEKNAFKADIFLQNAGSTIKSLDVQISGLLQTDIPLSLLKIDELKLAPAVIMKDLGYSGRFFYGGSGTWQKLDSYVTTQGFSEILFSTHIIENAMKNGYKEPLSNSWGAFDNYLFDFIKDTIIKNSHKNPQYKSFNMIMTTSNHPPYNVPMDNAPTQKIEKFINSHKDLHLKPITARLLAHIWWQDKMIAKFIEEMSEIFPNSLFIVTGDHYDREYPFSPASLKVQQSVPLIVYSPVLNFERIASIGSHIDITPTIVNLVAPNHYPYFSFGKPMLKNAIPQNTTLKNAMLKNAMSQNAKTTHLSNHLKADNLADFALGFVAIANDRFIYDGFKIEYFNDKKDFDENLFDENLAKMQFMQLKRAKALSWWILKNGYVISDENENSENKNDKNKADL